MSRKGNTNRNLIRKARLVRHQIAVERRELRQPSEPRESPSGPVSAAIKRRDPEIERLVTQYLARKL